MNAEVSEMLYMATLGIGITIADLALLWYMLPRATRYMREGIELNREKEKAKYKEIIDNWERQNLPALAINLAIRDKLPEEEYGYDFDISRMPQTFNPLGKFLEKYFEFDTDRRERSYRKLKKLTGIYSTRRKKLAT